MTVELSADILYFKINMWQNKIQKLWQSIQKADPNSPVCEQIDPVSGQITIKCYADLIHDLDILTSILKGKSELKIAIVMEKSYASLISFVFPVPGGP